MQPALLGLLGALIGVFFSPPLKFVYDKYARRIRLRADLVKFTYQFFALQKNYIVHRNFLSVTVRKHTLSQMQRGEVLDELTAAAIDRNVQMLLTLSNQNLATVQDVYIKLTLVESEIAHLIEEVRDMFSADHHKSMRSLLRKDMRSFDELGNILVIDFNTLNLQQITKFEEESLTMLLTKKNKEIEKTLFERIDEIHYALEIKWYHFW